MLAIKQNKFTDKKLSLIDNNLTDIDIVILVDALKGNSYIKEIDLSFNNISNQGTYSLASITNLEWLNVSSNNIGPEGCIALSKSNLITIHISGNPIGNAVGAFASSIKLKELVAAECEINDDMAKPLFLSTLIESLDLSTNKILGLSLEMIDSNIVLKKLNLAQNPLKKENCKYFINNKGLLSLNLTNTVIGDNGAELLARNCSLEELTLIQCSIGDNGVLFLSKNTTLKKLVLLGNNITDRGIEFLARNNSLLYLNLKNNSFSIESSRFLLQNYLKNIGFIFTRTDEFILELLKKRADTELHSTKFVSSLTPQKDMAKMLDKDWQADKTEKIIMDMISNAEFLQFFITNSDETQRKRLMLMLESSYEQFTKKQKTKQEPEAPKLE
jgi:hypothetical protein